MKLLQSSTSQETSAIATSNSWVDFLWLFRAMVWRRVAKLLLCDLLIWCRFQLYSLSGLIPVESWMDQRWRELQAKAHAERRRCRNWLLPFMTPGQPKFCTRAKLRSVAMKELDASKNSFDFAWIDAIEATGRQDWYKPLRSRRKPTLDQASQIQAMCRYNRFSKGTYRLRLQSFRSHARRGDHCQP